MKIFKLPDLGEGLPEAEIAEWHVKEGDTVTTDQPIVSMETAKAVVEVPSPWDGVIAKLYGKVGDIINTGEPLVGFAGNEESQTAEERKDSGTVVGNIESSGKTVDEQFIIGSAARTSSSVKATPAVRNLARKLTVDLSQVTATGPMGTITQQDVEQFHAATSTSVNEDYEPLRGVRRTMVKSMTMSHQEVVAVTLCEDADIHGWSSERSDITVRLVQALVVACQQEPALNAWYDAGKIARKIHNTVDLGLAVDTPEGLFVPVIKDAGNLDASELRQRIDELKQKVKTRQATPAELTGTTITLSNFGSFAGRYANPIIVPPTVAIIGVGRLREEVVAFNGQMVIHKIIPLSLTFDHRAVTGGEASRFLGILIRELEKGM